MSIHFILHFGFYSYIFEYDVYITLIKNINIVHILVAVKHILRRRDKDFEEILEVDFMNKMY